MGSFDCIVIALLQQYRAGNRFSHWSIYFLPLLPAWLTLAACYGGCLSQGCSSPPSLDATCTHVLHCDCFIETTPWAYCWRCYGCWELPSKPPSHLEGTCTFMKITSRRSRSSPSFLESHCGPPLAPMYNWHKGPPRYSYIHVWAIEYVSMALDEYMNDASKKLPLTGTILLCSGEQLRRFLN